MDERSRAAPADPEPPGGERPCAAHVEAVPDPLADTLAQLVHEMPDAVVVTDRAGIVTYWNDAATRLFGWPAERAVGRTLDLIVPERFRDRHWEGFRRAMETGDTAYGDQLLEVPALHRDGRRLSIAFTVTLLRRPGEDLPSAIAAVVRDETARREQQRELRAELEALRAAAPPGGPAGGAG